MGGWNLERILSKIRWNERFVTVLIVNKSQWIGQCHSYFVELKPSWNHPNSLEIVITWCCHKPFHIIYILFWCISSPPFIYIYTTTTTNVYQIILWKIRFVCNCCRIEKQHTDERINGYIFVFNENFKHLLLLTTDNWVLTWVLLLYTLNNINMYVAHTQNKTFFSIHTQNKNICSIHFLYKW